MTSTYKRYRKRILLVDDDKNFSEYLKDLIESFSQMGHEIFMANNSVDGIKMFKLRQPDFVLIDIVMPEMDGFELLSEIKKISGKGEEIKYIAVSGAGVERDKVIAGGFDDYLKKPIDIERLTELVEDHTVSTNDSFART